jgi:GWxTD domain-containing protein
MIAAFPWRPGFTWFMSERRGSTMRETWSCSIRRAFHTALALGVLAWGSARAQYPNPSPPSQPSLPTPGTSAERPRFSVDATLQPGEGGTPEVRIDYRLNRMQLLFQRGADGYTASYEVTVVFNLAKGGHQIAGDSFTRQIRAASYSETRLRGDDIVDQATFRVPPGRYRIRVYLKDLVAERTSGTEVELTVPERTEGGVWLSDITLGLVGAGSGAAAEAAPNPSHRYGENVAHFAAWGEVVDRRASTRDTSFALGWYVQDDRGERAAHGDTLLPRSGARTPYRLSPALSQLPAGEYRFFVSLRLSPQPGAKQKRGETLRQSKIFEVEESKLSLGPDARGTFEVLRTIADRDEMEEMSRLTTEQERRDFWDRFWKKRDPSPDTPQNEEMQEFYRRVQYANQHFGTGGPGWKSDMGQVYIKYGPPDEVDRHPFNFDRPPEEIWYYYRDRWTFVFVDRDGFGRYQLDLDRTTAPH